MELLGKLGPGIMKKSYIVCIEARKQKEVFFGYLFWVIYIKKRTSKKEKGVPNLGWKRDFSDWLWIVDRSIFY